MTAKAMTPEQREAVRQRLVQIEQANGGRLTPDDVVKDAKKPSSPLHEHFEWDVKKAAAQYWIEQARTLITSVRIVTRTETTNISSVFYVRDPSAASDEQGYVSVSKLRTDTDLAHEAIVAEFSRVAALLRRARELAIVLNATEEIDDLLGQVIGLRERFVGRGSAARQ